MRNSADAVLTVAVKSQSKKCRQIMWFRCTLAALMRFQISIRRVGLAIIISPRTPLRSLEQ
nr:MAG TPA: hypothetical protein [Caudoviricetes sp.]